MYFKFGTSNSKEILTCSEENFIDELDIMETDSFNGNMNILVSDTGEDNTFKLAGTLKFHAHNVSTMFDIEDQYNNDLYICMNSESQDQEVYYEVFLNACIELMENEDNNKPSFDDIMFNYENVYLMTIDDFCIKNEFRRKGIAKLILNNLPKLMKLYYNIDIMTAVGLFNPHDNEPEEMLDIQKKCYGNCGFTIYKEGIESYFYKNMITEF